LVTTRRDVPLTVETLGQGSVTLDPPGGTYVHGTEVALTASPSNGWQFVQWGGDLADAGSTSSASIVMDGPKSVTATFRYPGPYTVQGVVWFDANANGVPDEDLDVDGINGVTVMLLSGTDNSRPAPTCQRHDLHRRDASRDGCHHRRHLVARSERLFPVGGA
jgi:hypothetical protein